MLGLEFGKPVAVAVAPPSVPKRPERHLLEGNAL